MEVKLISYSQPIKDRVVGVDDCQDLIAYCARVSNPDNQNNKTTSEQLLEYLIRHKHWSPFEMVSACMEITTTRDIARQMLRHRSFSFQEFSQRYADPTKMGGRVLREARLQDTKNRQNSIETEDDELQQQWIIQQDSVWFAAYKAYRWAIAKEQARAVLPEGLTESKLYMNGTLRSWIHYIDLREKNGTQKEHMDIARACAKVIAEVFPMGKNLFESE